MDNPTPSRPLGLATLITATITLFSPMGMDATRGEWVSQSLADQAVVALQSPNAGSSQLPQPGLSIQGKAHALIGPQARPPKELPADLRTARLVLSVESLFKATTPN